MREGRRLPRHEVSWSACFGWFSSSGFTARALPSTPFNDRSRRELAPPNGFEERQDQTWGPHGLTDTAL